MLPAVEKQGVDRVVRQDIERIRPLGRQDDELAQLVVVLGVGLEVDDPGPETIGIEVIILDGGVAPNLVVEVGRLITPSHVDSGGRRLDDLDPAVSQCLVHQRFDAVDGPLGLGDDLGPLCTETGVMPARPERDIAGPSPEDIARPVRKPNDDVAQAGLPRSLVGQARESSRSLARGPRSAHRSAAVRRWRRSEAGAADSGPA